MAQDAYRTLGVARTATGAEIRRAYLVLAKRYHPDLNRAPGAGEMFLAVKEAYEVLSSPLLRREYDERLARSRPVWEAPPPLYRVPRVIRVTAPYPVHEPRAVRIRPLVEERRRRQLSFAYTAVTATTSVVFLVGAFLLVALGGVVPGVALFLMGIVLVLLVLHVFPVERLFR